MYTHSGMIFDWPCPDVQPLRNRIADLERQVADMTAERLRTPGAYYVVPKDVMDAKDARIAELEAAAKTPACDHTMDMLRIGQLQHDIAKLKSENAEFKARRNASKKHRDKENRLLCEEGKYDKCGVGGISVDAATKAAGLAESMLENGHGLSYAAACLLVLRRELESVKERAFIERLDGISRTADWFLNHRAR